MTESIIFLAKILGTIALATLAGWSYRFGGSSNGMRWVREVGCGIAILGCLTMWLGWNIWGLFVMGSVWIETTYFKSKGTDATWFNWFLVGLSYAIVPLPYILGSYFSVHPWHYDHWLGFGIRSVVITIFTTLWRTLQGDANDQEVGCGVMQVLTLPLLLI